MDVLGASERERNTLKAWRRRLLLLSSFLFGYDQGVHSPAPHLERFGWLCGIIVRLLFDGARIALR